MKKFVTLLASGLMIASVAGCTDNLTSFLTGASASGSVDSVIRHGLRVVDSLHHLSDSTRHDGSGDSTARGRSDSTEVHHDGGGSDSTEVRHDGGVSDSLRVRGHDGGMSDTTRHDGGGSDTTHHDGGGSGRGSDTTRHDGGGHH